jgi:hypothetical protein
MNDDLFRVLFHIRRYLVHYTYYLASTKKNPYIYPSAPYEIVHYITHIVHYMG